MRAPALASLSLVIGVVATAACGRVGYEPLADDTDAADNPDAPIDVVDTDAPPGVLATCGDAVLVHDYGLAQSATLYGIDVTSTDLGFVVAWTAGMDNIWGTGIQVHPGPYLDVIQPQTLIRATSSSATMAIAALGNDVMLGVDDPGGPGIMLYPMDERGMLDPNLSTKYIDTDRAYGHAFVSADPANNVFVVMGSSGTVTNAYRRDRDIHPSTGPDMAFPVATESAGATATSGGYVFMTGNSSNCDVRKVDASLATIGTPQPISMTCHHASGVHAVGSNDMVFGWNCDNDAVWVTGGDPAVQLPAHHAVYGDSSNSASNPRLGATSDGVWFAYQVAGGRLGRALLDTSGNPVSGSGNGPMDVHQSSAIKAYDLAVHGDTAFLFWIEQATRTELYAMKLCAQ